MTAAWYVGVAENRRDELAELQLTERGFDVFLPKRHYRVRTVKGSLKPTYDLLISPYFFVRFDAVKADEYSLVMRSRGVSHVLESKPEVPAAVSGQIIVDHRERELYERANTVQHTKSRNRRDLVLLRDYVIVRHELFKGYGGKLFAHTGGSAYLDCRGTTIALPDGDIELVAPSTGKAA